MREIRQGGERNTCRSHKVDPPPPRLLKSLLLLARVTHHIVSRNVAHGVLHAIVFPHSAAHDGSNARNKRHDTSLGMVNDQHDCHSVVTRILTACLDVSVKRGSVTDHSAGTGPT